MTKYKGEIELSIKPETALLVNNKPFFIPHFTSDIRVAPCMALRICRLGRNIEQRFGTRYYDAVAAGLDFTAYDKLTAARQNGNSLSAFNAFDNSFAISKWQSTTEADADLQLSMLLNGKSLLDKANYITNPADAVALASRYFKLCTGDIIAISAGCEYQPLKINDEIEVTDIRNEVAILMNIK